ncbi:DUF397 domain-containing protein [Streptomyces sp. NPDC058657]|uniref:DUF397 domain-containing protein n=1 Tax=unclassified Streptomyces TaxID=2593676 RepID=UPI0036516614
MDIVEKQWQKSSFSTDSDGNCLELASRQDTLLMRESDDPGTVVRLTPESLDALLALTKAAR